MLFVCEQWKVKKIQLMILYAMAKASRINSMYLDPLLLWKSRVKMYFTCILYTIWHKVLLYVLIFSSFYTLNKTITITSILYNNTDASQAMDSLGSKGILSTVILCNKWTAPSTNTSPRGRGCRASWCELEIQTLFWYRKPFLIEGSYPFCLESVSCKIEISQ